MVNKQPKIDIFIPYWGDFELLQKAVSSVLQQTSTAWHLTIVDDHSPIKEAEAYYSGLKDQRITYIRHKENVGITKNFNFCISQAKEEYCVIMGCDDMLLPAYVETALSHIGSADMYQPQVDVINANGESYLPLTDRVKRLLRPRKPGFYAGEPLAASLCHGNWLYFPSIVWKTTLVQKYPFDESYSIVEDVVVELTAILNGAQLYLDSATTFQYRRFAESLSSKEKAKNGVRFNEEPAVYSHFSKVFNDAGWHHAARSAHYRITSRLHKLIANIGL